MSRIITGWGWFVGVAISVFSANSITGSATANSLYIYREVINAVSSTVRQHPRTNLLWEPAYQMRWQFFNPIQLPVDSCLVTSSQFQITGRGGLPPNPGDALSIDAVLVDLITLNPSSDNRSTPSVSTKPTTATQKPIVEATGWVRNSKGEVELTANAPTTPHGSWQKPVSCRAS